ncbi:SEL1 repeat-containing protein [Balamuthia mandrillaris]
MKRAAAELLGVGDDEQEQEDYQQETATKRGRYHPPRPQERRPIKWRHVSNGSAEYFLLAKKLQHEGSLDKAFQHFLLAAQLGNPSAQNKVGGCFDLHTNHRLEHHQTLLNEAVSWWLAFARQGNRMAQNSIAWCYAHGYGVQQNHKEAARWYLEAAKQGLAVAQYRVAKLYHTGFRGGPKRNYREAARWYVHAARGPHPYPKANELLHQCFTTDKDIFKNKNLAYPFKWYLATLSKDEPETVITAATQNLGLCLLTGKGVAEDEKKGFLLLRTAADQGNLTAMCNVAICYLTGRGVEEDNGEAAAWLLPAAQRGHLHSQFCLGNLLYNQKKKEEGEEWCSKAALAGHAGAMLWMARIARKRGRFGEARLWLHRLESSTIEDSYMFGKMQKGGRMLSKVMDRRKEGRRIPSSLVELCSQVVIQHAKESWEREWKTSWAARVETLRQAVPKSVWANNLLPAKPTVVASFFVEEKDKLTEFNLFFNNIPIELECCE